MGEIKFRAWLKEEKKIVEVVRIDLWNKEIVVADPEDPADFGVVNFDDAILMQYTGLKDKNGREIYEGDIVRWTEQYDVFADEVEHLEVVKYDNEICGFRPMANIYKDTIHFDSHDPGLHLVQIVDLEIVGNIYENPELLQEVKE